RAFAPARVHSRRRHAQHPRRHDGARADVALTGGTPQIIDAPADFSMEPGRCGHVIWPPFPSGSSVQLASSAAATSSVVSMDFAPSFRSHIEPHTTADAFSFGIEEEYFLVDARTKSAVEDVPKKFFEAASKATDGRSSTEFLQPQIEVISSPHQNMADART